jgi:hypothetical protein
MSKNQEELNMEGKFEVLRLSFLFQHFLLDEEVNIVHVSRTAEENEFDTIVTALEELLLDDGFQEMQSRFCERHCGKCLFSLL